MEKQIKDFLNLMEEAHNEIEKEVEKRMVRWYKNCWDNARRGLSELEI